MTRILKFDGPRAVTRFTMLYAALLGAGDGKGDRTRAVIRKEARVFDALEAVSQESKTVPEQRELCLEVQTEIVLSQEELDLLITYADTTPWTPRAARDAVDLQDWLAAAERRD